MGYKRGQIFFIFPGRSGLGLSAQASTPWTKPQKISHEKPHNIIQVGCQTGSNKTRFHKT